MDKVKETLRRVFLLFDPVTEQAYLNDERPAAQEWADGGKPVYEYALVGRVKGVNDIKRPAQEESA